MKRFSTIIVLFLATALFATACSQGNVFDLAVGQCFNDPSQTDEVSSVPIVDCGEPHDNEVFHLFDIVSEDWPGDSEVGNAAANGCLAAFDSYVGLDYANSIYDIDGYTPTQDGWDRLDDREVVCFLIPFEGGQTAGTALNSQR